MNKLIRKMAREIKSVMNIQEYIYVMKTKMMIVLYTVIENLYEKH